MVLASTGFRVSAPCSSRRVALSQFSAKALIRSILMNTILATVMTNDEKCLHDIDE